MELQTYITNEEKNEYSLLYDRLYALYTLRNISSDRELRDTVLKDIKVTVKNIRLWWKKIDDKYILTHSENGHFEVDKSLNAIFLVYHNE